MHGYEFQFHHVVETLASLLGEFTDERAAFEEDEVNGERACDMLMRDLAVQIGEVTQDRFEIKVKTVQTKLDVQNNLMDIVITMDEELAKV